MPIPKNKRKSPPFAGNAEAYNFGPFGRRYPDSRFLIGERGCYATWFPGRNFQNRSRLYGAYPPDYVKRVLSMFPKARLILHLFSGSLTKAQLEDDARDAGVVQPVQVRFDSGRHPLSAVPDVRGDAQRLDVGLLPLLAQSNLHAPVLFDLVLADPPYRLADQRRYWRESMQALEERCLVCDQHAGLHRAHYGKSTKEGRLLLILDGLPHEFRSRSYARFKPLNKKLVVEQCRLVLKSGGWLVWLDEIRPFYANRNWTFGAAITIVRSTGHRVRMATALQKTPEYE